MHNCCKSNIEQENKMNSSKFFNCMLFIVTFSSFYNVMTTWGEKVTGNFHDEDMLQVMFQKYMRDYKKDYIELGLNHPLYFKRYNAFKVSMRRIVDHNNEYEQGKSSFSLGLNHLADLTDDEYQSLLGYKYSSKSDSVNKTYTYKRSFHQMPDTWDWREHNAVTPVKNQGMCGSCWSFSAVASLESVYAIATGNLVNFSEQELVDCVLNGTDTCNHGGEMQSGFEEIINHHHGKIDTEADYPYTASSLGKCMAQDDKAVGSFIGYQNVTSGDEEAMKDAVANNAVLAIAIDASSFYFQLYRHGVFDWPLCKNKPEHLDHGVALVGYGTRRMKDFWLVKNSWGTGWGMQGYIMMSRNKKNQCGIATDASFPLTKKD